MRKGIHPNVRPVIFRDSSSQAMFLALSTVSTDKKGTYDGKKYPLVEIEISSATHPFYTGTQQLVDTAGRIERFNTRYKIGDGAKAASSKQKKSE